MNLTFHIKEGPQVKIRSPSIFVGNRRSPASGAQAPDEEQQGAVAAWPVGWITGHGTYQEAKYEEDADKIVGYYRDQRLHRRRASATPS